MEGAFRRPLPDGLRLIETFGMRQGRLVRFGGHLARLERTARLLGIAFDRQAVIGPLAALGRDAPLRVRLTLGTDGGVSVEAAPLPPGLAVWRLAIAEERLDPADPWLRVKTTERGRYDRARAALPQGVDEWVFLNRRGEVCEGTITNVFLRSGGGLLTPPVACGLLPGVLRGQLVAEGKAREAVLRPEDLVRGEVLVGNSLRGLCPAVMA